MPWPLSALSGAHAVLAPSLVLLVGAVCPGGLALLGRGQRVAPWCGRVALALALGMALRLLQIYWSHARRIDGFGPLNPVAAGTESIALVGSGQMDWLAAGCAVALLLIALGSLARTSTPSPLAVGGLLLAGFAATSAVASLDLTTLASLWMILALGGAAGVSPNDPQSAGEFRRWWVVALVGPSVLWATGALLAIFAGADRLGGPPAPRAVPSLLLLIAASVAGLGPFAGLMRGLDRTDLGRYVARAGFRIVGFALAVRVITWSPAAPTLGLRALLIGLALWGIGAAMLSGRAESSFGRIFTGLAFLGLGVASTETIVAGLILVAAGAALDALAPEFEAALHERLSGNRARPNEGGSLWPGGLAREIEGSAPTEALVALAGWVARTAQSIENRYDLAAGLLVALVVVFAFVR